MRSRHKVLIVDDEEAIVLGLARILYQDNDRYDVLLAANAEIAERILTENEIDVMVSDIRLPGKSGIDLLCWAASESPRTRVIMITAYDVVQYRDKAYRHGCLEIVQKPFDLHEMRALIGAAMERRDSFTGTLDTMAPSDVVQLLCLTQRTTALRVVDGEMMGVLHIDRGEIVHALCNDRVGEAAVYRLLSATRGKFDTLPLPKDGPRSVHAPWQHLLLEAARIDDETRAGMLRGSRPPAAPSHAPEAPSRPPSKQAPPATGAEPEEQAVDASPHAAEVGRLVDEGFEALRRRHYDTAREVWEKALGLDPGNRAIELNLRRLERMRGNDT
jgi:DNA-binding response OmpR family regulator